MMSPILDQDCSTLYQDASEWNFSSFDDPLFSAAVNAELDRIALLRQGWDGDKAAAIGQPALTDARRIIDVLAGTACRPKVVPLATGGLQFEWHNGPQTLEIAFECPGEIDYLKFDPRHGIEQDGTLNLEEESEIRSVVAWFMKGLCECPPPSRGVTTQ